MKKCYLEVLYCPDTGRPLFLENAKMENDRIREGILVEQISGKTYPIINFIPRFVGSSNYADSFGLEWNFHDKTQHDLHSGYELSRRRYEDETRWGNDLEGEYVLEAGCGAGRFTTFAAESSATVISFDYSNAIDVNYRNNGNKDNILFVQADICKMPFRDDFFDKVFCLGVLQHTPDPQRSFSSLVKVLKPGGRISTDIYIKDVIHWLLHTKTYARIITKKMDPEKLYKWVKRYIDLMWPLVRQIRKIPWKIGQAINWRLLVADFYQVLPNADDALLKEWAYLDTFDMLSPKYDNPQTVNTFKKWHENAHLVDIDVHKGHNGIEGRGVKPCVE